MPLRRLRETSTLLAFYHPEPAYPVHILLVPKAAKQGLQQVSADDARFLVDLFQTVQILVQQLDLEREGYRLIANGGSYQEFPQLHFHLVSGSPL
jgi:histidine triad (HIT) family protein